MITLKLVPTPGYTIRPQLREGNSYWAIDRQITEQVIRTAINSKYPQGSSDESVQDLSLQVDEALQRAVIDKVDEIQLERSAVNHIYSALQSWAMPYEFMQAGLKFKKHVKKTLDEDEAASKLAKAAPEAPKA